MNTSIPSSCPQCGSPIPEGAPHGLCPRCLMLGVAEPTQTVPAGMVLPTREEIEQAFPEFEVMELIGHGGMGAVFRVRQKKLDRVVALKVLLRSLAADPSFAERFRREGKALAKLNHPNIVTVHDFGEQNGWYYLIMEYVDGINLRQAMRTNRFSPEQALEIVPKICEALHYAHGEGILHRDIKPENILLDSKGRVKIADFGIAKLGNAAGADHITLTMSGARLGTMAYMAPEQIENSAQVDHRADIYSLGVVFYEMLTGELPIGRFSAPSQKSPVNTQVDDVVFRTLEKERERRYQSAGEMKTEVETLVGQSAPAPQVLTPAPMPARPVKPAGRWSGPGMALGWMLIGLVASFGMMFGLRAQRMAPPQHQQLQVDGNGINRQFGEPTGVTIIAGTIVGIVMASFVLLGTILGWKNAARLRHGAAPRQGVVVASIAALLLPLGIASAVIMSYIRNDILAWMDGIVLTGIVLTWFCCWMNPRPRPWSAKAVLGFTLILVPLPFIAHAWSAFDSRIDVRWAQEMNVLQDQINQTSARVQAGMEPTTALRDLEAQMQMLHFTGRPRVAISLSSSDRACFAVAALFAVFGTLLGWMARAELLKSPGMHRGLGMAKIAAYFWPIAILPLLIALLI